MKIAMNKVHMTIILINNKQVVVDEQDCNLLSGHNWYIDAMGYVCTDICGRRRFLHRVILGLHPKDKTPIDHIDRNPLNNCRSNLRLCTQQQNNFNVGKRHYLGVTSSSQYKGVYWDKQGHKWQARSRFNNKLFNLCLSSCEIECAYAYNEFVKATQKEFAHLNEISSDAISDERKQELMIRINQEIRKAIPCKHS